MKPSAAKTGSDMTSESRENTASQSSIGAPDVPVDEGGGGEALECEGDCMMITGPRKIKGH